MENEKQNKKKDKDKKDKATKDKKKGSEKKKKDKESSKETKPKTKSKDKDKKGEGKVKPNLENEKSEAANANASIPVPPRPKKTSLIKPKKPPNFSADIYRAFRPYRIMLLLFGRFPISAKQSKQDGTYVYSNSMFSVRGLWFIFCSLSMFVILVIGTINFTQVVLQDKSQHTLSDLLHSNKTMKIRGRNLTVAEVYVMHLRETALFKRHQVSFIAIWTSMILGVIGSVNLFLKRAYLVNFLNFWSRAVHTMHMDVSKGLHKYSLITLLVYGSSVAALGLFGALRFGPTSNGAPTMLAMFMFRLYDPTLLAPQKKWYGIDSKLIHYQFIAGATILFVYIASRAYVFMFLFKCKLLQNAFAAWNGRVYAAVLRGGEYTQTLEGRTTYSLLFKDHCVLLDLMEGTDHFFSGVIEAYYGLQVASICFEFFFLLRVAKEGNQQGSAFTLGFFLREHDWAPAAVIVFQSISLLWIVSRAAAAVGEEAIAGLEVIRRKTMLGRKTDEELYFTLSMYSSYTAYKKLEISGGGYFYLNKEFIIGVVSSALSYFIIILQFNPALDLELPGSATGNSLERESIGRFLSQIEDLMPGHWKRPS